MCKLIRTMLSLHSDHSAICVTHFIGSQHHHSLDPISRPCNILPYFSLLQNSGNFPLVVSIISLLSFSLTHPVFGSLDFHLNLSMTVVLIINCSVFHILLGDPGPFRWSCLHSALRHSLCPVCSTQQTLLSVVCGSKITVFLRGLSRLISYTIYTLIKLLILAVFSIHSHH